MNFQIVRIILWPKNRNKQPRVVELAQGRLNIISGVSRTGKSAIIPIIDYCLGADRCTIPTGVIRLRTAWFGVVVRTDEGDKLFARREPELQQSTDDMFLLEAPKIDSIPEAITKNTSRDSVKQRLDHLAGLTKLSFSTEQVDAGLGRPSFRDLTAFLFQPQNIVANPNVLFYKAETVEHRQKLRTIFPYVLGALDAETLARRHELQQLQRELRRKEQELENVRAISQRWLATTQARVAEARDLGLLEKGTPTPDSHADRLVLLRQVVTVPRPDLTISSQTVAEGVDELNMLHSEEASVAQELSRLRRRFAEMEQLRATSDQVRDAVQIQRDRLHVSRWLQSNQTNEGRECPVCGNQLTAPARELDLLVSSLEALEQTTSQFSSVPATFDRELQRVRSGIAEQTERLRGIRIRQSALTQQSEGAQRRQYSVLAASRFLGRLESELRTLDTIGQDGELSAEVESLRERVQVLEKLISQAEVTARTRRALNTVNLNAGRIIPLLDAERPEDPISLSETELTISVQGPGRDDFLWEIGSGSNWLSYHVAVALGLQQFFISLRSSPVPTFVVFDQPSQVYFPKRLADRGDRVPDEPPWQDQDVEAVRKIMKGMAAAIALTKNRLQIIVLDHASDSVWGSVPLIQSVEDWRDGRALIPLDWISDGIS